MSQGGKRANAGRKFGSKATHTIQAEAAKKLLVEMFIEHREPIFQALITKASTGDIPAMKELFERVWGKVPASIDAGEDGQALFQIIIKQMNEQSRGGVIQ
jgi:hypothetical protein